MRVLEIVGICVVALLVLLFALFVRRRLLMAGGGTIRLQVRVSTMVPGRGWSSGIGQFVGDELRFHRMFSFAFRPKRVLNRRSLLGGRPARLPEGPERLTMPGHWVILACTSGHAAGSRSRWPSPRSPASRPGWRRARPVSPAGVTPRRQGGPAASSTS